MTSAAVVKITGSADPRVVTATKWRLLYRATRDGFKAKKFHELCDEQGPTLTVRRHSRSERDHWSTALSSLRCSVGTSREGQRSRRRRVYIRRVDASTLR